jgi:prepilin-type N-terminal cleavage/methylation domain-containing protein
MTHPPQRTAFSLLEVLVSVVIIAILIGLLLPSLIFARDSARATLCAGNLRQIGYGWLQYLHDFDRFPRHQELPEWKYGGVVFTGPGQAAVLASDRPINRYVTEDENAGALGITGLFKCPSDAGIGREVRGRPMRGESILPGGGNCFQTFGSSYRANRLLLDWRPVEPTSPRPSTPGAPLRPSDVMVSPSRLLVLGDPEWYYATRHEADPDAVFDATWHSTPAAANFMALDGSIKFHRFSLEDAGNNGDVTLNPRPLHRP